MEGSIILHPGLARRAGAPCCIDGFALISSQNINGRLPARPMSCITLSPRDRAEKWHRVACGDIVRDGKQSGCEACWECALRNGACWKPTIYIWSMWVTSHSTASWLPCGASFLETKSSPSFIARTTAGTAFRRACWPLLSCFGALHQHIVAIAKACVTCLAPAPLSTALSSSLVQKALVWARGYQPDL